MKKIYVFLLSLFLFNQISFAQADCSSAVLICGNTQPFNPSGVGQKMEQLACGSIEHNSVWMAFQAKASGKLNFVVRPFTPDGLPSATDFDWTFYKLPGAPGVANCDNKVGLSCNYSAATTGFGVPGGTGMASPNFASGQYNPGIDVVLGDWYVLMVDQFNNSTPLLFSVQFNDNPESPNLNSSAGIFDNRPNFTSTTTGCGGVFSFTNTSAATSGIASYLWNFGDGTTSTSPSPSHTYVTNGNYFVTLTVTDNNGCKSDIRKQVTFNNTPPVLTAASIFSTPACTDVNNGTLTITTAGAATPGVTGGTPPYMYELVSPSPNIRPAQTSNVFTGLQPGGYVVKVTDACGKSATTAVTVAQTITNSAITIGVTVLPSCSGSATGSVILNASATVPPYTFSLINTSPVLASAQLGVQRDPLSSLFYTQFNNLLPGVYTTEVVDGCGKIRRATFTITTSTAPLATTVPSPSCATSPTGTLTVTTTGSNGLPSTGTLGSTQFALIAPSPMVRPYQNGSVFENLWPGTYTVAVKDVCGNIGTSSVTITAASAPTFGTQFTSPSCPNSATGTIEAQINGIGGGSPYLFELIAPSPVLRPAQNSNAFANLPPGVYTIRLTDVCGVPVTTTATVAAAAAPTFTTTLTTSCITPASGTVTVVPGATAIGPFSFELIAPGAAIRPTQIANIANTPNSIFTGLNTGNYTIRMTDGCGVPVTNTAVIAAPTALSFPAGSLSTPSCAASATGQITVATPSNGLAAFKYELIAPSPVIRAPQYDKVFNNLPVGSYTIRITDSCGSQITIAAPLAVATATAPTLSATNTASCTTASGTITCLATTANQGGGTYQYALIAPSPTIKPNQASPIFTGLSAGAYTVQITDQCGLTGTVTTTIAAAGTFTPAAGGSVVACSGAGYVGQIIVTAPQNSTVGGPIPAGSGGGAYTYALYDAANAVQIVAPQASNIFTNVTPIAGATTHTVRVTDVCGNTSTVTVAINPPAAITTATISATQSSCAASATGTIKVTTLASGGLAPYTYTLIDAVSTAVVAGPITGTTFNPVPASATGYFVRTTDACGNIITSGTALLFPAAVVPTVTAATSPSCTASATGRITASPGTGATLAGGTFSYALYDAANAVLIAGPQASPVFSGLAGATYTVRIIDVCGTTGTAAATVAITVTALTSSGTAAGTCTGGSNGTVTASSTGGSLPITYTLIDQATSTVVAGPQASTIFTNLPAATYIVRSIDACGTITNSANVVLGNLTAAPTITTSLALDCAGTAKLGGFGATGSGGPYTYALCTGAACTSFGAFSTTNTFTVSTSGTYVIAVRDRCGNQTSSSDIVVAIPAKAQITAVSKANVCGTTTITPTFTGVPNTAFYSVDGANFTSTLSSLAPGCHNIRVANNNAGTFGCASDAFDISVFGLPTLPTPPASDVNCSTGAVTMKTTGGSTGCVGSGATLGIKLTSCTGCSASALTANPIGTILNGPSSNFNLGGATSATFAPVVRVAGSEICAGSAVNLDFATTYCLGSALPISIEYFRGNKIGATNKLIWKINCDNSTQNNVTLERSGDNFNFLGINSIVTNVSTCQTEFNYIDLKPFTGINYYRLKIIDNNGKITYSMIVTLSGTKFTNTTVHPNPAKDFVTLFLSNNELLNTKATLVDASGKTVQSFIILQLATNINLSKYATGVYLLKLQNGEVLKLIKQ